MGKTRIVLNFSVLAAISLFWAVPGRAHHAFSAEFDPNRPVQVTGKIVRLEWTNPHAWIYVDVVKDGQTERWAFELGSPSAIARRGFTKDHPALSIGTEINVDGFMSKGVPRRANGRAITYVADGTTMFVGSSGTGAPDDGRDPAERKTGKPPAKPPVKPPPTR